MLINSHPKYDFKLCKYLRKVKVALCKVCTVHNQISRTSFIPEKLVSSFPDWPPNPPVDCRAESVSLVQYFSTLCCLYAIKIVFIFFWGGVGFFLGVQYFF